MGTQYRSVIYTLGPQQQAAALHSRAVYQQVGGDTRTPLGTQRDTGTPLGTPATSPSPASWGKLLPGIYQAMGQWDWGVHPAPPPLPTAMALS